MVIMFMIIIYDYDDKLKFVCYNFCTISHLIIVINDEYLQDYFVLLRIFGYDYFRNKNTFQSYINGNKPYSWLMSSRE